MAWLINWYRRKPKLVRGSTAGAQIDYQLKLTIYKGSGPDTDNTIYLGGYSNNDFSDLRFTSSDEITLLPYYIESYISGVSAIVWIKIDSIPADPFSKTIYIYYDNPVASTTSSYTEVFAYATGGNITYNGNYTIHTFLTNGTFTPYFIGNVEVVVIGGGGAGGGSYTGGCGCTGTGGGSGGVNIGPVYLPSMSPISVTIGVGGIGIGVGCGVNPNGGTGGTSSFGTYMVATGGPGGSSTGTGGPLGSPGGYAGGNAASCLSHGEIGPGGGGTAGAGGPNYGGTGGGGNGYGGAGGYISAGGFAGGGGSSGWSGLPGQNGANGIVVVKYLNRVISSPEPTWSTTSPEQIYTANLAISSIPSGAKIYINNQDYDIYTYTSVVLNPGTYTILLTKAGYQDYIEIIVLSSNQNAIVQGNLISITGNLDISSTPSGAEIFLAPTGSPLVDQGIDTPNIISLSPGIYDYKLTHTDYYDATGSFTITAGLTTTLNVPLTLLPCPIVPKYSGNTVTLKATPKDGTGPYYVEFRKNGVDIDPARLSGLSNPILSAPEDILITRVYTLDDLDISSALTGTIDFSVYMEDSCPTGVNTCTETCTINIGCLAPVCNFTIT